MAMLIQDNETVQQIERLATATGKSPAEVVAEAVRERMKSLPGEHDLEETESSFFAAIRRVQEVYRQHADPNDHRTADEIIGYNEHGHFD